MNSVITRPNSILASFLSVSQQEQVTLLRFNALLVDGYNHKDQQVTIYYYYGYYVEVTLDLVSGEVSDITPFKKTHFLPSERKTSASVTRSKLCMAA